jgi:hypothetical protein
VSAKVKDVRAAAYRSLASMDDPAATDVLKAAIAGKDIDLAAAAIARSTNDNLPDLLIAEITKARTGLPKLKDKQEMSEAVARLCSLIAALPKREHAAADALTLDLFARRGELAKVKGADKSGSDVADAVIQRMGHGNRTLQAALARANRELDAGHLSLACVAGQRALPSGEVFERFAGYLTGGSLGKKGSSAEAVVHALGGNHEVFWYHEPVADERPLDPRWFDLAVEVRHLGLVNAVGRALRVDVAKHASAQKLLQTEFDATINKAKDPAEARHVLAIMVRLGHPNATDALVACFEKALGTPGAYIHWYFQLAPGLPKSAQPQLEALVPKLKEHDADLWLATIQRLREKD